MLEAVARLESQGMERVEQEAGRQSGTMTALCALSTTQHVRGKRDAAVIQAKSWPIA